MSQENHQERFKKRTGRNLNSSPFFFSIDIILIFNLLHHWINRRN